VAYIRHSTYDIPLPLFDRYFLLGHAEPVKHLVLIDGHHLMYRAYWAIPRTLKTSSGELTNAVFGVASMLLNILKREEPDALLFCFDAGEETFRHQENKTYKEGRAETPDEFYEQIPRILEMIDVFAFSAVSNPQYEADDFLGAYTKAGEAAGMRVTIVTGDRDCLQLAGEKTRIAIPHKGYQQVEYLDPVGVEAKFGVRPDQVASYKGLCGDASDNLPGVHGIGPKTAAALLQQFDSLKGIYDHLEDVKPSWREKLEQGKEQAFFCERMATLVCDMPLPVSLKETALTQLPYKPVLEFFTKMEFTALTKRFQSLAESSFGSGKFEEREVSAPLQLESETGEQMAFL